MPASALPEENNGSSSAMIAGLAGVGALAEPAEVEVAAPRRPQRQLAIYGAAAGFDLVEELDFLCARTVEPNLFFNPHFLAPAMPRLEDREVRLAVIRDAKAEKSRLRLLVPFTIDRPVPPFGVAVLRAWASPFGPLGTPLVDGDDPQGVVEDFFDMLLGSGLKMPRVLMLPDMRLDGPVAKLLGELAQARGLSLETFGTAERPFLQSELDGDAYLRQSLRPHHFREFRRLKRRLETLGPVVHAIASGPDEVRAGVETFLALEAAGWKGRSGTAMAIDRFRSAFVREAANGLAERGMCRVHTLGVGGKIVAALVVFVERGVAYTWKTAYDEEFAAFSPGTLLMIEVTKAHLADPDIQATDSCAVPDHPVMSRLWSERRPVGTMVIGLQPGMEHVVAQAARQFQFSKEARNAVRLLRNRIKSALRLK